MSQYNVDPGTSQFFYHVKTTLHPMKAQSNAVQGAFTISADGGEAGAGAVSGELRVPVASFRADDPDADPRVREWTHAAKFPDVVIRPRNSRPGLKPGAFEVEAEVEFHGVRRTLKVPVNARFDGARAIVDGECEFKMTDFGINPPSILLVLKAKDYLRAVFHVEAHRNGGPG